MCLRRPFAIPEPEGKASLGVRRRRQRLLHTMAILRQTASQEKLFQTNIQTGRDSLQMETVSVTSVSRVRLSQIGSLSARIHPIVATGLACGC